MKKAVSAASALCLVLAISGCANMGVDDKPMTAKFLMAGPVSAEGLVPLMRWQYGLQVSADPKTISEIRFSCDPIPGSTFVAKADSLRVQSNGSIVVEGPALPVTHEATPWLFDRYNTTEASCRATIARAGQTDTLVQAPVSFSPGMKTVTLQQFNLANEHNRSLKKK